MLVDTHCHLNFEAFAGDLPAVLDRARAAGIERMVVIGTTLADSTLAVELAAARPELRAAVGVHPHEAASLDAGALAELRCLARRPEVVAIGETGLDMYRNRCPEAAQREAFRRQMDLARELALPLIIHSRAALEACHEELAAAGAYAGRVVMHCFTTEPERLAPFVEAGCWVSVGGPVTYPKADDARAIAAAVPAGRLMLETDCPFLAPQSARGRRCEPAHVRETAVAVAAARGVTTEELIAETGAAAAAFFGWECS